MRLKKLSIFLSIPALALSLASCGNSSEKPTKDEAKAGMAKIIKQLPDFKRANLPDSVVKSLSSCVVDKIYDKAKPETLKGLADGNKSAAKIDPTKVTAKKIVASKRFLSRPRRVV